MENWRPLKRSKEEEDTMKSKGLEQSNSSTITIEIAKLHLSYDMITLLTSIFIQQQQQHDFYIHINQPQKQYKEFKYLLDGAYCNNMKHWTKRSKGVQFPHYDFFIHSNQLLESKY
jgi:hypothetical protein